MGHRGARISAVVGVAVVIGLCLSMVGCSDDEATGSAKGAKRSTTSTTTTVAGGGSTSEPGLTSATTQVAPGKAPANTATTVGPTIATGPVQSSGTTIPPSKAAACSGLTSITQLAKRAGDASKVTTGSWPDTRIVISALEEPLSAAFETARQGAPELATNLGTLRDYASEVMLTIGTSGDSADARKQVDALRSRDAASSAEGPVAAYASSNCALGFVVVSVM